MAEKIDIYSVDVGTSGVEYVSRVRLQVLCAVHY
jgi:hypothetical protein